MDKRKVSRRKFLAHGPAAAAAAGLSGCAGAQAGAGESQPAGGIWERPPDQRDKGNRLNVILLNVDTFRADNLECYGSRFVDCPCLNSFAKDCIIFEDAYPEALPTVPIRRNLMTGRRILPFYYYDQHDVVKMPGWHQLYYEDVTLAETLQEAGYATALVADLLHFLRPGRNFHRGYGYFDWIRGHSFDYHATVPHELIDGTDVIPAEFLEKWSAFANPDDIRWHINQYKLNMERWRREGESLVEITARKTIAWLKENQEQKPFFLHMEAFDPHEPWDPPRRFLDKYLPNAKGPTWTTPPYEQVDIPPAGVERLRANYFGESACVDYWVGEILKTIGELGLYDNSSVVFMSDHGALLGEQGQFCKGPERLRRQATHIPLLFRMPHKEHAGKRISGFVQIPDYMPTLLSRLGLESPPRVTGQDFWPLVSGEASAIHDYAVMAYGWIGAVRTQEWNFSAVWNPQEYPGEYAPQLYNRTKDPDELTDVAAQHPSVVANLKKKLDDYIAAGAGLTSGHFNAPRGVGTPTY